MSIFNPLAQYQNQAVNTATPGELIVLLFGGAIKNIHLAMNAIKGKKINEANNCIIKAENIFYALTDCLDMRIPISTDLRDLYEFINSRLIQANMKKDIALLEEILPLVVDLRNTWQEAEKINRMEERKLG